MASGSGQYFLNDGWQRVFKFQYQVQAGGDRVENSNGTQLMDGVDCLFQRVMAGKKQEIIMGQQRTQGQEKDRADLAAVLTKYIQHLAIPRGENAAEQK